MPSKIDRITVAQYLEQQINLCDKSQKQIADETGYEKPNIITMFKQGKTKLPVNKVPAFAKALGVDPIHLLRVVMGEYMPDTWEVLDQMIGDTLISRDEAIVLTVVRETAGGYDVAPHGEAELMELAALVGKWRERAEKRSVTAYRTDPLKEKGTDAPR